MQLDILSSEEFRRLATEQKKIILELRNELKALSEKLLEAGMIQKGKFLTIDEAAKRFSVSDSTIRRWIRIKSLLALQDKYKGAIRIPFWSVRAKEIELAGGDYMEYLHSIYDAQEYLEFYG